MRTRRQPPTEPAPPLDADGRFVCRRYRNELTISPTFCARLFERARAARRNKDPVEIAATLPCHGCDIGRLHAGQGAPGAPVGEVFVPGQSLAAEPRAVRQRRSRIGARLSALASKQRAAKRRKERA